VPETPLCEDKIKPIRQSLTCTNSECPKAQGSVKNTHVQTDKITAQRIQHRGFFFSTLPAQCELVGASAATERTLSRSQELMISG
jgi:hypothetical protein